jgi:hypothetical protein
MLPALLSLAGTGMQMYAKSKEQKKLADYQAALDREEEKKREQANRDRFRAALASAIGAHDLRAGYQPAGIRRPGFDQENTLAGIGQILSADGQTGTGEGLEGMASMLRNIRS